jgi:hypothetical protein
MLTPLKEYLFLGGKAALDSHILWYGLLLCIFLIFLLWTIRKLRSELLPVFNDDDGSVQITPQALRELVKKCCTSTPGIHSSSTAVGFSHSKLRLKVQIRIDQNTQVKETRLLLKQKLETTLLENLNCTHFGGIDIVIKGFNQSEDN